MKLDDLLQAKNHPSQKRKDRNFLTSPDANRSTETKKFGRRKSFHSCDCQHPVKSRSTLASLEAKEGIFFIQPQMRWRLSIVKNKPLTCSKSMLETDCRDTNRCLDRRPRLGGYSTDPSSLLFIISFIICVLYVS